MLSDRVDYVIQPFKWGDISQCLEELVEMQRENIYKFHYPSKQPNEDYILTKVCELKEHLNKEGTYFIGGLKNGKLCGYIWCYETIFLDEKRMIINSFFVRGNERGRGLGHLLMERAKRIAIERKCVSMATHYAAFNTSAGSFYTKSGFSPSRIEVVCKL